MIKSKHGIKKSIFADNIGIDLMVSGDFGELLLAYYFAKQKLHVIVAKSAGFDLLVKDPMGKIFKKNKLIGISVKTRQQNSFSLDLDKDIFKLERAAKVWDFIPYFCFVTPHEAWVFPLKVASDRRVRTKVGRVSLSKIKKLKKVKRLHFDWGIKS